jgi:hypothetical protein
MNIPESLGITMSTRSEENANSAAQTSPKVLRRTPNLIPNPDCNVIAAPVGAPVVMVGYHVFTGTWQSPVA